MDKFTLKCIIKILMKLLATDLDGTLFYRKGFRHCISKRNIRFLQKFIDEGNKVCLVSSRSGFFTSKLKKEINRPIDFINCSSSEIIAGDKTIRNIGINNKDLKKVLDDIDKKYKPIGFLITTDKYPIVIKDLGRSGLLFNIFYKLWNFFQFCYKEKYIVNNKIFDEEVESGNVYKAMIFYGFGKKKSELSKELNKILRDNYPEIESSWSSILNELTPKNCSKGNGLEYYCKYINVKPEDVYCVGDSGNDITMFLKYHENSFAMKHSYPSVKKYAHYVVPRVYNLAEYVLEGEKE